MQVLRWSAAAALAAMVSLVPSYANDDLNAMKASMDNMKIEMEAMRSQMAAEREAMRSNAGGAPEALQSAKGNATIRIGGDVRLQYQIGWGNGYNRQGYTAYGEGSTVPGKRFDNYRSTKAGWDVARAQLKFDVDLSCDTKGFISLRFDDRGSYGYNILDNAWWQWNNIGGSGLSLRVGLQDMPFGMYNSELGGYSYGVDRAIITDPFVKNAVNNIGLYSPLSTFNDSITRNVTNLGVVASYNFDDQLVVKGALMAGGFNNYTLSGKATGDNILTWDNQIRNPGFVDHIVSVGWNPCWLEGLHAELAYMGTWDSGRGGQWNNLTGFVGNDPYRHNYTISRQGDSEYRPTFDLGLSYKINDQFTAFAEGVLAWNPMYSDGYSYAMTVGLDYRMTEKLMFGASFDYMHGSYSGDTWVDRDGARSASNVHANLYRISVGGKYDFGNGIYFQAQYYHDLCYMAGVGDQDTKDADTILFQTGYQF